MASLVIPSDFSSSFDRCVRNTCCIQNEYTDWERPARSQIASRDATMELLSDGHTAAPLIRMAYLHSVRGGRSYFLHFRHQTSERDFPQVGLHNCASPSPWWGPVKFTSLIPCLTFFLCVSFVALRIGAWRRCAFLSRTSIITVISIQLYQAGLQNQHNSRSIFLQFRQIRVSRLISIKIVKVLRFFDHFNSIDRGLFHSLCVPRWLSYQSCDKSLKNKFSFAKCRTKWWMEIWKRGGDGRLDRRADKNDRKSWRQAIKHWQNENVHIFQRWGREKTLWRAGQLEWLEFRTNVNSM